MNREPKPVPEGQWTVAAIAADPKGAFEHIRQIRQVRNAWQRKFDEAEMRTKRKWRGRLEASDAALTQLREGLHDVREKADALAEGLSKAAGTREDYFRLAQWLRDQLTALLAASDGKSCNE